MKNIFIAGVKIESLSKAEFLKKVDNLVKTKKRSYVVTPYSEFIVFAQHDKLFKAILNKSDISIADGFGILFGAKYLSMKGKFVPLIKCIFGIFFNRKIFYEIIPEKLSGSEIVYDVCKLSEKNGYSIFLLGGFDFGKGNTGELAKSNLEQLYPSLKITGTYAGSPAEEEEESIINKINESNADILFVAYGPVRQEKWIFKNLDKLNPMVSFGLGGTFDFVSGEKKKVPEKLREMGLEGILRPFFSEKGSPKLIFRRLKRSWGGIIRYLGVLIKSKNEL